MTAAWIAVTDRLPEHEQLVLVWYGSVEVVQFLQRSRRWQTDDVVAERAAVIAEDVAETTWQTEDEVTAEVDYLWPTGPYFSGGGGDCTVIWTAARGFASRDNEGGYGWQPPITHWMPLPAAPTAASVTPAVPSEG